MIYIYIVIISGIAAICGIGNFVYRNGFYTTNPKFFYIFPSIPIVDNQLSSSTTNETPDSDESFAIA